MSVSSRVPRDLCVGRAPRAPRLSLEALEDRCVRSGGLSLAHIALFLPAASNPAAATAEVGGLDIDTAAMLLRVLTTNANFDSAVPATDEEEVDDAGPGTMLEAEDAGAVILPLTPIAVFDTSLAPAAAAGTFADASDDLDAVADCDPLLLPSDLLEAVGVTLADASPPALVPAPDELRSWLDELLANTPSENAFSHGSRANTGRVILMVAPARPSALVDLPATLPLPALAAPPFAGWTDYSESDFASFPVFASEAGDYSFVSELVGTPLTVDSSSPIDAAPFPLALLDGAENDPAADPVVLEEDASSHDYSPANHSYSNYSHETYSSGGHAVYGHGAYDSSSHAYPSATYPASTYPAEAQEAGEDGSINAELMIVYWQGAGAGAGAAAGVGDAGGGGYSGSGYASSGYSEANWTTDQCPWMMAVQDRNLPTNQATLPLSVAIDPNPTSLAAYGQDQVIAALLRSQASVGTNAVWAASIVAAGRSIRAGGDGVVSVEAAVSVRAVTVTTSETVLAAASTRVNAGTTGLARSEVDAVVAPGTGAARFVSAAKRGEARSNVHLAASSDDAFESWQDLAVIALDTEAISADPNVDPALMDAVFETLPATRAPGLTPTLAASGAALVVAAASGLRQKSRRRRALRSVVKEWIQQGLSVARLASTVPQRTTHSRVGRRASDFAGHHPSSNWIRVQESTREATEIVAPSDADSNVA